MISNYILPIVLLTPFTFAIDRTVNPDLNSRIKLAATSLDRHSILTSDSDWIFDFNNAQPQDAFKPGSVKNANAATFPALTNVGMTLAQLNLGPCAMLPPHLHPRATNVVIAITGNTTTYMFNENGARVVKTELTPGLMTIFPTGSLHTMQNNGCEDAYLISALNSDDTGTLNILNGLWSFDTDMVKAAFGNVDFDAAALSKGIPEIGTGASTGSAECLERCGML